MKYDVSLIANLAKTIELIFIKIDIKFTMVRKVICTEVIPSSASQKFCS